MMNTGNERAFIDAPASAAKHSIASVACHFKFPSHLVEGRKNHTHALPRHAASTSKDSVIILSRGRTTLTGVITTIEIVGAGFWLGELA